jgi:Lrp/AsnC family transcriptional regulator, leucine-responsive regulatory protein
LAQQTPQVSECHRVTGDDCFLLKVHAFLLKVHAAGIAELEPVLDRFLLLGQTTTAVVVATVVAPRTPTPPG